MQISGFESLLPVGVLAYSEISLVDQHEKEVSIVLEGKGGMSSS